MYCPECHHPLAGDPESCPNCGKALNVPSPGESAEESAGSIVRGEETSRTSQAVTSDLLLDKKVYWSAICLVVPVVSYVIITVVKALMGDPAGGAVIIGLGIAAALILFGSIILIPTSLILSILGLRSIKRSENKLSGKMLAMMTISVSTSIVVGGTVLVIFFVIKFDMDTVIQEIIENNPEAMVGFIQGGIDNAESTNRENGIQNAFGKFFPATLDSAEPFSESGPENPFFTEVLTISNGVRTTGWRKGEDVNTYIITQNSTGYVYDPATGTFIPK